MSRLGPVVVGVEGTQLGPEDRERLSHPLVGMVILFASNYESPEQLQRLTAEIHALREPSLLIAVDHEGGRVQRFRSGFTRLPPMRALGRLWDRDVLAACRAAASVGYVLAAELRAHGVDFSFTPVLDLDHGRSGVIGDRALHSDPRVVTMLASHLMHGLQLAGMANCGSTIRDMDGPKPTRTSTCRTTRDPDRRSSTPTRRPIAGSVGSSLA